MVPADAPTFAAYRSDPHVARYQGWEPPLALTAAEAFVAAMAVVHAEPGSWVQLSVVEQAGEAHVGDVAFCLTDDGRQARVGITIARSAQHRGYGAEALGALLDHLLGPAGLHRVLAECDARNTASARLLERVGMRLEARHLAASWWKGEWTDDLVFAVLATERSTTDGTESAG